MIQVGPVRVGVLALQGDFAAHLRALEALGAPARTVRTPGELAGLDGLVLPGGESTALLRLMEPTRMRDALLEHHRKGGAFLATCAGLILLASRVLHPEQESLGLLEATVERNAYGRQIESFVARGRLTFPEETESEAEMVFIRAPKIRDFGSGVRVLGWFGQEPVLIEQGPILAATFHPEMSAQPAGGNPVHRRFLQAARSAAQAARAPGVGA